MTTSCVFPFLSYRATIQDSRGGVGIFLVPHPRVDMRNAVHPKAGPVQHEIRRARIVDILDGRSSDQIS